MPEPAAVLARMDANMRASCVADARTRTDGFVDERPGVTCVGSPHGSVVTNMALVTDGADVATIGAATTAAFRSRGLPHSVWTRAHADVGLEAALTAAGWTAVARVPAMLYREGDGPEPPRPPGCVVREVVDDAGCAAYAHVAAEAWTVYGNPPEQTRAHFPSLASLRGADRVAFVAWCDDAPVACAMVYLAHGLGGIGWVGTLPPTHGRGFGAAVTWAAMHEAFRRGVDALTLQASPMGEPVYRRLGFSTPTHYGVLFPPG